MTTALLEPVTTPPQTPARLRAPELDLLRAFAAFAVVVIHVSSMLVDRKYEASPAIWWEAVFLDGICRWGAPIFVMVSGALLIPNAQGEGPDRFFRKRLARIGIPTLFWTLFYLVFRKLVDEPGLTPRAMAATIIQGTPYYHLYFLYMMAGLYLLTPMLRSFWAGASRRVVLMTALLLLLSAAGQTKWSWMRGDIEMPTIFTLYLRFLGYYLLGALIASRGVSRRMAAAAIAIFLLAAAVTIIGFGRRGSPYLFDMFSVNVIAMSVAAFIAAVSLKSSRWLQSLARSRLFCEIVACSMGIYLVHPLFQRALELTGAFTRFSNTPWFMPLASTAIFTVSLLLTVTLRHTPFLRRIIA